MADLPQAFFLPTRRGSLFCLYHHPKGPVQRGQVLHLHPFAEELNTCRRISAQFARALAEAGFAVLQFDMYGCGDSEGDFGDATWATWRNNAQEALTELHRRAGEPTKAAPLWLWGVRSGTLMSADMLQDMSAPCHVLWWQPVISGQQVLQQWLRLNAAKAWLGQGPSGKALSPSDQLKQGQTVHVAGYTITPALAQSLTAATLQTGAPAMGAYARLLWMELTASEPDDLPPAVTRHARIWQNAGWAVTTQALACAPFWQQFGDTDAPALAQASLAGMA